MDLQAKLDLFKAELSAILREAVSNAGSADARAGRLFNAVSGVDSYFDELVADQKQLVAAQIAALDARKVELDTKHAELSAIEVPK